MTTLTKYRKDEQMETLKKLYRDDLINGRI